MIQFASLQLAWAKAVTKIYANAPLKLAEELAVLLKIKTMV